MNKLFGWLKNVLKPGKKVKSVPMVNGMNPVKLVRSRVIPAKRAIESRRRKGFYDARGHNLTAMGLRMKEICGMNLAAVYPAFR